MKPYFLWPISCRKPWITKLCSSSTLYSVKVCYSTVSAFHLWVTPTLWSSHCLLCPQLLIPLAGESRCRLTYWVTSALNCFEHVITIVGDSMKWDRNGSVKKRPSTSLCCPGYQLSRGSESSQSDTAHIATKPFYSSNSDINASFKMLLFFPRNCLSNWLLHYLM